jgi:hypothetical protein
MGRKITSFSYFKFIPIWFFAGEWQLNSNPVLKFHGHPVRRGIQRQYDIQFGGTDIKVASSLAGHSNSLNY